MTIRDASEADLTRIVAIYNDSIPGRMATADTNPVTVESRGEWFFAHSPQRRPLWIAQGSADNIVGWLSFQDFYGRPAYAATAELSIYVAAEAQGQGIGSQLLGKAVREASGLGLKTLLGFIFAHNAPSLELFKKYGFERWGFLPRVASLDGLERDLCIVGLRIER
jgi:phosphinothricin acetyltransferase